MSQIQASDNVQMNTLPRYPKVTIGMPVFNGAKYICEALDSLLAQTFTDFDLIIADNASTDETEQICAEYASRDKRVQYFRHTENRGASANFLWLLNNACGEYFMWAAHDDIWAPNWLAVLLENFEPDDIGVRGRVRYLRDGVIVSDFLPTSFPKQASVRYFLEEESKGRVHYIFSLFCTEKLRKLDTSTLKNTHFATDLVFVYEILNHGALRSVAGTSLECRLHSESEGQRMGTHISVLSRLLIAPYPFAYYKGYFNYTHGLAKLLIAVLIPVKHLKSQAELGLHGLRKAVIFLVKFCKNKGT